MPNIHTNGEFFFLFIDKCQEEFTHTKQSSSNYINLGPAENPVYYCGL